MYMKWVEFYSLNLNDIVQVVRGGDLWVIDRVDAVVGCLMRWYGGGSQSSSKCRVCVDFVESSFVGHWQKLLLANCSALVTCISSNVHGYRAVDVYLCCQTDHSFQMVSSCMKSNPVAVISEQVRVRDCMHDSASWPKECNSWKHKLRSSLQGAMKASVRVKLVMKFESTSCLEQTWVLECDVVWVLKRVGLWTSTTHEVRS